MAKKQCDWQVSNFPKDICKIEKYKHSHNLRLKRSLREKIKTKTCNLAGIHALAHFGLNHVIDITDANTWIREKIQINSEEISLWNK